MLTGSCSGPATPGRSARAAVWHYDPVILTTLTPPARHRAQFARLAQALTRGPPRTVDEVVLSSATVYAKTKATL